VGGWHTLAVAPLGPETKTNDTTPLITATVHLLLHWAVRVPRLLRRLQKVRVWISSLKNRLERSYEQHHPHFITYSLLL
jgi:hypothetical protein